MNIVFNLTELSFLDDLLGEYFDLLSDNYDAAVDSTDALFVAHMERVLESILVKIHYALNG